ncbi:MAG: hypothetical protein QOE34_514, partial [Verrucomicrobiota bacterium]
RFLMKISKLKFVLLIGVMSILHAGMTEAAGFGRLFFLR